jgi:uncharacterized protein (DUF427 family)
MQTSTASPGFQSRPDHRITVEPFDGTVTVRLSDAIIASSQNAKVLREADYPPVFYIPFDDIYFDFFEKTDTRTHCPFKGDATYWRATAVGESADDVLWAYEHPYQEMLAIKGYGAFDPKKVRIDTGEAPPDFL